MRAAGLALAAACLLLAGCSNGDDQAQARGCPIPVHYDKATLDRIQKELEKMPPDSAIRQAMTDYENERDDLRFCR